MQEFYLISLIFLFSFILILFCIQFVYPVFLVLFFYFQVPNFMHRSSNFELLPFDPKIERTLFKRKKVKADKTDMEYHNNDRFSEGNSDQIKIPGIQEPTLVDCWRPMMNEDYSGIRHQPIDANNFELKPTLISMVQ